MKVLNAVPLMTTASRKAMAFSLIIRISRVPCFVVVLGSRGDQLRGEREVTAPADASYK